MKKSIFISVILLLIMVVFCLGGCNSGNVSDGKYALSLDESGLFKNSRADAIAQTEIAKKVQEHVQRGSNKKALYIAFDGARSDLIFNISKHPNTKKYPYAEASSASGINLLKEKGGLYLAYTGGDVKKKETLQDASTIPGFSTLLSGKWANEHKVYTNNLGFDRTGDTILMSLAKQGKNVSFNARWDAYFTCLFKSEFDEKRPNYSVNQSDSDKGIFDSLLNHINKGDDLVFGIFENTDYAGHNRAFGNHNPSYVKAFIDNDMYAFNLIRTALAREGEDWLIVVTTDHGGHNYRHGTTKFTDTTTFIATNKEVFM